MPLGDSDIIFRLVKGLPLTAAEGDNNFRRLRDFANALEAIIGVVLNPDGTLKDGAVSSTDKIADRIITYAKMKNIFGGAMTGGPAAYTADLSPDIPAGYISGDLYVLTTGATANTGAVTLDVDGTGALPVTKLSGAPLAAGDFPANGAVVLVCLVTSFALVSTTVSSVDVGDIMPGSDYEVISTRSGVPVWAKVGKEMELAQVPTATGVTSVGAHGLSATPSIAQGWLECVASNNGYTTGQRVPIEMVTQPADDGETGVLFLKVDSANVSIESYVTGFGLFIRDGASGALSGDVIATLADTTKWKVVVSLIRF